MDAKRFDNLARSLATRFSRRRAIRQAGAAATAGVFASIGLRTPPAVAQGDGQPVYTVVRRYTLDDAARSVRQALQQGYVEDACNAPGFVAYFTVEDEDGDFVTVSIFQSQQDFQTFANAEANWIAQNLGDLLPAPDVAISGQSYIRVGMPQAFEGTCPGDPPPAADPAPTTAPAPTNAPAGPTPTPPPACTGQGCACTTGTQAPCDDGLVCCPTTDLMGGPGICQTQDACYPNQCTGNGDACDSTCNWGDACPRCCSNFCNSGGQCDDLPVGCTGAGCACATGTQSPCDAGLICCGSAGVPGGPGVCTAQSDCGTPCTGANCSCDPGDADACDQGLACCAVQSGYICISSDQCGPAPCTSEGCACAGGVDGACDAGLICCLNEAPVIGGNGGCVPEEQCGPVACTGAGCDCVGGVDGACDDGLICCVQGDPGAPGTCQTRDACPGSLCTGPGCDCASDGDCADGLICCVQGDPGAPGTCQTLDACPGSLCTGEGCECTMSAPACADGLICCGPGEADASGTCQTQDNCTEA